MMSTTLDRTIFNDPVSSLLAAPHPAVLALISDVEGPSYRPLGATMTVFGEAERTGTLSSGCIEDDIALHAMEALKDRKPTTVRYGRGSPFMDIKLPCGGGLEILLLPDPDRTVLEKLQAHRAQRIGVTLSVDMTTGQIDLLPEGETMRRGNTLMVRFEPELRFLVFGKGPEACTFAALAQAAGYPNMLISPDEETRASAEASGCETLYIPTPQFPQNLPVDHRTAIVLFFHDHEWEPPIIARALETEAFYIGAQGSRAASMTRNNALRDLKVSETDIERLAGPIGLIHSARDARTLAISVLAEVVDQLQAGRK